MYWPVVVSPGLSFEIKGKQRSNVALLSPTILYSIGSVYIMRECMRTLSSANSGMCGLFPPNISPKSSATILPQMCQKSALKNARPNPSFAS